MLLQLESGLGITGEKMKGGVGEEGGGGIKQTNKQQQNQKERKRKDVSYSIISVCRFARLSL